MTEDLKFIVESYYEFKFDNQLKFQVHSAMENTVIYKVEPLKKDIDCNAVFLSTIFFQYISNNDLLWFYLSVLFRTTICEKHITMHVDADTNEYYAMVVLKVATDVISLSMSHLVSEDNTIPLYTSTTEKGIIVTPIIPPRKKRKLNTVLHYSGRILNIPERPLLYNEILYSIPYHYTPIIKSIYSDIVKPTFPMLQSSYLLSRRMSAKYNTLYGQKEIRIGSDQDTGRYNYQLEMLAFLEKFDNLEIKNMGPNRIIIENSKKWNDNGSYNMRYLSELLGGLYSFPENSVFALTDIISIDTNICDDSFSNIKFIGDLFILDKCIVEDTSLNCTVFSMRKGLKKKYLLVLPYNEEESPDGGFNAVMVEKFLKNNKKYSKMKYRFVGSSLKYSYLKLF